MVNKLSGEDYKRLEGRSFVIGREGHIYLSDNAASKHHAEIKIVDGRIYLRDLGSTNGTYLLRNQKLVQFHEGFVRADEPIVIGSKSYTARMLIQAVEMFAVA